MSSMKQTLIREIVAIANNQDMNDEMRRLDIEHVVDTQLGELGGLLFEFIDNVKDSQTVINKLVEVIEEKLPNTKETPMPTKIVFGKKATQEMSDHLDTMVQISWTIIDPIEEIQELLPESTVAPTISRLERLFD